MIKKKIPQICAGIALLSATVCTSVSLAWFHPTTKIGNQGETNTMPIDGSSSSGYFAYGNGSSDHPYGIKSPRHLYNLAWLQYLNAFNGKQLYFELADNVDMSGWILPPIGTEDYPFVSNFNGKGYVVSNLTVSNDFSTYNVHPAVVNVSNYKVPHILGVFGVVGDYNGDTIDYNNSINKLYNIGFFNANVKTSVKDSLMGIAVGYNDSDLQNIVVDSSTIDIKNSLTNTTSYGGFTNNISDYSLVGYTTKSKNITKASQTMYGINVDTNITFNASEEGTNTGWGGSIDMKTMYNGLLNIYNSYSSNPDGIYKYYRNRTIVEDRNGNVVSNTQSDPVNNSQTGYATDNTPYNIVHYGYEQKNSAGKVTSSYSIARRDTSQYLYLYGHRDQVPAGANQTVTKTYYPELTAFNISQTVGGTTHYLVNGNTSANDTTTVGNATKWVYANDNFIKTSNDGETIYYLTLDNTHNLTVTNNVNLAYQWSRTNDSSGSMFCVVDNGYSYYLYYDNGWTVKQANAPYFYIRSGSNYLTRNGNELTNSTNTTDATKWYWSSDNYFYPNGDDSLGLVYYYYRNNNYYATRYPLYLYSTDSSRSTVWMPNIDVNSINGSSTVTFSVRGKNFSYWDDESETTYYIRYNKGWTTDTTSRNVTVEKVSPNANYYVNVTDNGTIIAKTRETYEQEATYDTKHTYFPLRQNNNDGTPMETNTGYVISGTDDSMAGDIRVSYYSKRDYLSNGVNTVYTINDSGRQTVTSGGNDTNIGKAFVKYADSKSSMSKLLNESNIYGLHFMNASIRFGEGVSAIAESATVNGTTYDNYELPINCIDFSLKEKGYINFFAGTYFSGNNSFFSLHEIQRDSSHKIVSIKKIAQVYSDGVASHSYQYRFSDGTYSVPYKISGETKTTIDGGTYVPYSTMSSVYSGYTSVFKTSWIERQNSLTSNYAYYFEIPMNDGEFCLGSVDGGTGAYLMYLDIGANAAKTNRTVIYEHFKFNKDTFSHPIGIILGSLGTSFNPGTAVITQTVDSEDSVCVVVRSGATGSYKIDREVNDVTLTRSQPSNALPVYVGETITKVHEVNSTDNIDAVGIISVSQDVKRMTYYDYMLNTDSLIVTTFTDISSDGTNYTRSIVQTKYSGTTPTGTPVSTYTYDTSGSSAVDETGNMKVYKTSNGAKYTTEEIKSQTSLPITTSKLSNILILEIKLIQENGSFENATSLNVVVDQSLIDNGYYYKYGNYLITIIPTGDSVSVKVTSFSSTFDIKVYNSGNNSTSYVSTPTVISINETAVELEGQTIEVTVPNNNP